MMRKLIGIGCLVFCGVTEAHTVYHVKHVLMNTTKDTVNYRFRYVEDGSCESTGTLQPGFVKQIDCESDVFFKRGTYQLDFDEVAIYSKKKIHCQGSKSYFMGNKKIAVWKLGKGCTVDISNA